MKKTGSEKGCISVCHSYNSCFVVRSLPKKRYNQNFCKEIDDDGNVCQGTGPIQQGSKFLPPLTDSFFIDNLGRNFK